MLHCTGQPWRGCGAVRSAACRRACGHQWRARLLRSWQQRCIEVSYVKHGKTTGKIEDVAGECRGASGGVHSEGVELLDEGVEGGNILMIKEIGQELPRVGGGGGSLREERMVARRIASARRSGTCQAAMLVV
ncbi:hypothetical protein CLOP_g13465 [Closterium sp. NIES-67]|nr:hypothetical protein CLOP_g13465 [Closterium sp. NIES-67]